jgi:hypothetical protein
VKEKKYTPLTFEMALDLKVGDEVKYTSKNMYANQSGAVVRVVNSFVSKLDPTRVVVFTDGFPKGLFHSHFSIYQAPKLEDFI